MLKQENTVSRGGSKSFGRPVFAVAAIFLLTVVGCSAQPSVIEQPATGEPDELTTVRSGSGSAPAVDRGSLLAGLAGVEVEVTNAVAPYDHHSNVDSLLLEMGLHGALNQLTFDCIAEQGFARPQGPTELLHRDDPFLMANLAFPHTERLASEGFPFLPPTPASPDDFQTPSEAEREASRVCARQVHGADSDLNAAIEIFGSIRSAWEVVLDEIETLDEVVRLKEDFSACVRDEGIPASSSSEHGFLSYVDFLRAEVADTAADLEDAREQQAGIKLTMGRLYAECGRELFEAREQLRGGERRARFLAEHEAGIRELNDFVYGQ